MATIELDTRSSDATGICEQIENALDGLGVHDSVHLITDHDPASLREQLEERRADQFTWQALHEGPDAWESDITSLAHVVDARPTLAAGGEPFGEIMKAAGEVAPGEVLVVFAPFDPVPLQGVLGAQGFSYDSQPFGDGDFRVVFRLG